MSSSHLGRAVVLAVLCLAVLVPAQAGIIDSVNASGTPEAGVSWNWPLVGWMYTPSFSYNLDGVLTEFGGSGGGQIVTEEIWSGLPGSGGTLLRSGTFGVFTSFAGPTFAPLTLTAGNTYLIGFRNVAGLYVNIADPADPTIVSLGSMVGSTNPLGSYELNSGSYGTVILEFSGSTLQGAVPEPGSLLMLAAGLGLLALRLRRSDTLPKNG